MALTIGLDALTLVKNSHRAMLLGIITGDEVRLIAADPVHTPGHAAWLKSQPMPHVRGGFSLGTDRGEVTTFFRMSELNPPPGFLLSAALTREVLGLLPTRPDIKVHTD